MKIDRIAYEQLYPTGVYANQRYRAEATLEDGDDEIACYKRLQDIVEKTFIALNPQIQWSNPMFHSPTQEEPTPDRIQAFIDTINYCTNKTMVERFRKQVERENNERLTEAFNLKLKSLP